MSSHLLHMACVYTLNVGYILYKSILPAILVWEVHFSRKGSCLQTPVSVTVMTSSCGSPSPFHFVISL